MTSNFDSKYVKFVNQVTSEESKNGVVAHDIVKFKLPLGILGRVFGSWLVKFQLRKIFEFREKQLNKIFKK